MNFTSRFFDCLAFRNDIVSDWFIDNWFSKKVITSGVESTIQRVRMGKKCAIRVVEWTVISLDCNAARTAIPRAHPTYCNSNLHRKSRLHPCYTGPIDPKVTPSGKALESRKVSSPHYFGLRSKRLRRNFQPEFVTGGMGWVSLNIMTHHWSSTTII